MGRRTYVGFVRAVMIGREGLHRHVLLDIVERAGGANAVSYISTGNVSFEIDDAALPEMIEAVEMGIGEVVARPTPVFVRSLDRLRTLVDDDPFSAAPFDEVRARLVTFFRTGVPASLELPMTASNGDRPVFAAGSGEVFSVTQAWPDRQPQDPGGVIQAAAGEPVTTRAVGTIERIVAKLA